MFVSSAQGMECSGGHPFLQPDRQFDFYIRRILRNIILYFSSPDETKIRITVQCVLFSA